MECRGRPSPTTATSTLRVYQLSDSTLLYPSRETTDIPLHGALSSICWIHPLAILGTLASISTFRAFPFSKRAFTPSLLWASLSRCLELVLEDEPFSLVLLEQERFLSSSPDTTVTLAPPDPQMIFTSSRTSYKILHIPLEGSIGQSASASGQPSGLGTDIQASVQTRVALPINDTILQLAHTIWHTPDTDAPTLKGAS